MLDVDEVLSPAREMLSGAGELLRRYYYDVRETRHKGDIDLVTTADHAVEELVVDWIKRSYPNHSILAEESGQLRAQPQFRWIVDPLDGTVNFAHGLGHFAILIALQKWCDGVYQTQVSWTLDPMRDELFIGVKGKGATLNGAPIGVSGQTELRQSLLCTGFAYDRLTSEQDNHREFCRMNLLTRGVRRFGSAGLDLAYVACGRYDGFWERGLKPWDLAAGALLVEEAGGTITSVEGTAVDLQVGSVLCANPKLHPVLKRALDSSQAAPINSRDGLSEFLPRDAQEKLMSFQET